MRTPPIEIAEWLLIVLGMVLWLVALVRGRALEWFTGRSQLPEWHVVPSEFLAFVAALLVAQYGGSFLLVQILGLDWQAKPLPAWTAMAMGYGWQLGWLAVCVLFYLPRFLRPERGEMPWLSALIAGITGALLYFPANAAVGRIWQLVMPYLDLSPELQDSVNYLKHVGSVAELCGWAVLVLVLAPVAEEWVFRRLVYRFLAARFPDWAAIVFSSVFFALLHQNAISFLPLLALGVALALAYRYTGRLITPIAMHVVFNLNTFVYVVFSAEG